VRDDLRKMGVNNWKQKAQERKPWRGIIEQAKLTKSCRAEEEEEEEYNRHTTGLIQMSRTVRL